MFDLPLLLEILKISSAIFESLKLGVLLLCSTAKAKVSVALTPLLSLARNSIVKFPKSALVGVPLKVRVAALNFSQLGRLLPSFRVAE